jgi:CPA1 family monovalent cation:H+ antiporter
MTDGTDFPQRNLILFISFVVILLTLVVQGLTLPFIISRVKMPDPDFVRSDEDIDTELQKQGTLAALQYLKDRYKHETAEHAGIADALRMCEKKMSIEENLFMKDQYKNIYLEALDYQRQWLIEKNNADELLNEEVIRKNIRRIDLEEERLRNEY